MTRKSGLRVRLDVEYDGTEFSGFQRQENAQSIQGEIEKAIALYLAQVSKRAGFPVPTAPHVDGSGRTDAGVHARNQVVTFLWPEEASVALQDDFHIERMRRALDGITPESISIKTARLVEASFDPRRKVLRKQYSYRILSRPGSPGCSGRYACWVRSPLDIPAMSRAARDFRGVHDFQSFRAGDCSAKNSVREVLLSEFSRESDDMFLYVVQGQGFLKQMVRIMVGTLLEIGKGRMPGDAIPRILEARNRDAAGKTAPAQGLSLDWVRYQD